jgi:HAMP domain-containing protein
MASILASLLTTAIGTEVATAVRRTRRNAFAVSLALALLLPAYALLIAAVTIAIASELGAAAASLVVAVILALSGLIVLATVQVSNRRERRLRRLDSNADALKAGMIAMAVPMLPALFRNRTMVLLALAAGGAAFLATASAQDKRRKPDEQ